MKFKAKLSGENASLLGGVVSFFERVGSNAVVLLTDECLRLALIVDDPACPKIYSEIAVQSTFSEYRIESQSSNSILFEVDLNHLSKVNPYFVCVFCQI